MTKLVVANWKMNGDLNKITADLSYYAQNQATNKANVILAIPYLYLVLARQVLLADSLIKTAAQDLSNYYNCGAYTSKINGIMLKDCGVSYSLIGHSELRQYFGEISETVISKLNNAIKSAIVPILCVGELLESRNEGSYFKTIQQQLDDLKSVNNIGEIIIAYEPCWSIGTGLIPTISQIREVIDFIHGYMQKNFTYATITVLYGGSVNGQNAQEILAIDGVGGVLVGGASLNTADFSQICSLA